MSRITIIPWQPAKPPREENENFFDNSRPTDIKPMSLTEQMQRANEPDTTITITNEPEEDIRDEEN